MAAIPKILQLSDKLKAIKEDLEKQLPNVKYKAIIRRIEEEIQKLTDEFSGLYLSSVSPELESVGAVHREMNMYAIERNKRVLPIREKIFRRKGALFALKEGLSKHRPHQEDLADKIKILEGIIERMKKLEKEIIELFRNERFLEILEDPYSYLEFGENKIMSSLYNQYVELYNEYNSLYLTFEDFKPYRNEDKKDKLHIERKDFIGTKFEDFEQELKRLYELKKSGIFPGFWYVHYPAKPTFRARGRFSKKIERWFGAGGRGRTIKRKGSMGKSKPVKASKSKKAKKSIKNKSKKVKRKSNKIN